MILHSWYELEIGKTYPDDNNFGFVTDSQGIRHYGIKIKVLREATREEYLEFCRTNNCNVPVILGVKYYEVLSD